MIRTILTLPPMVGRAVLTCACAALAAWFAVGMNPRSATAAAPPSTRGPIATVGDRTVEAVDIQRAALALGSDPLRKQNPAQWRRMLLDRCVDRELLSMEAERRGFGNEPGVKERVADRQFVRLYQIMNEKVLQPRLQPTKADLESIDASGLYRVVDLHYILFRDSPAGGRRAEAERAVAWLRGGGRFDSLASSVSAHPSRSAGGHFGDVLVRDLDSASYVSSRTAKVGDILGPYSGPYGHEIYKLGGFKELTRDSIIHLVRFERERSLIRNYQEDLLVKYHFQLDSAMVRPLLFAAGSETPDSILASLRPDGTRPRMGVRPALGILARIDGDSATFRDIIREAHPAAGSHGHIRIRDAAALRELLSQTFYRRLLVRDAEDRGLTADPRIARDLRLIRDEAAVLAMVRRARPAAPGEAALQAWFDAHAGRYRRPAARSTRVAVFASQESALVALRAWNGVGISDSSLQSIGFTEQSPATMATLLPRHTARLDLFENDSDPLAQAVRSLDVGQVSPIVQTVQGFAVAQVLTREPARPLTLNEAIDRVRSDWQEEKENEWVLSQLERMRAKIPVRIIPARLELVKLGPAKGTGAGSSARR